MDAKSHGQHPARGHFEVAGDVDQLWRIRPPLAGDVDVIVVGRETGRRRTGICLHRVSALHPRDALRYAGIPITSPARTLLDIAPQLSERSLERAFDEALVRKIMSLGAVKAVLARYPHRRGAARIRDAEHQHSSSSSSA